MVRYRYSVRMLIVVVTLVAVYFPLAGVYDSWYASKYGHYYVANVLGFKIHNGDSFDRVASHFGSHQRVGRDHKLATISIEELWASRNCSIEDGDEIYRFSMPGDSATYLQFRSDRLINLTNSEYADASLLGKLNGYSLPHPILTRGFLPMYLVAVLVVVVMYLGLRRKRLVGLPSDARVCGQPELFNR